MRKIEPSIMLILSLAIGCMMLLTGCTGRKSDTASTDNREQVADSATMELPTTPPESADEQLLTIFDTLANDMVFVEKAEGDFYLCKFEVTQRLWKEVMGENPSEMQGDNLPVEQVSWNDCQTFLSRLNELTGKTYRLPTEAEWEYACRGGKLSKGYAYAGSDDIDKVAWYDGNSDGRTHPVGQKMPNEIGLYDMSGNVWEWCQDMHEGTGMCRGGSWIHNARNCDPTLKNETPQAFYINSLGLRLAL